MTGKFNFNGILELIDLQEVNASFA